MDQGDVCCAVIADPYFSIPTAAKILSRIRNTNLELIVITSLTDTDPDTEEKNSNVAERYRKFLQNNALILHRKLCIYNLYRGKERVFHDRYLIRYHADGRIDGFLLSNSLNSMGQFYPFVIAPPDTEVCLSVAEYLNQLQDMKFQKTQPKKERISCQVLHNYRDKRPVQPPPPAISVGQAWLAQWPDQNIPADALPTALGSIVCHFEEQPDEVCRMFCFLGSHTYPWSAEDLAVLLRQKKPAMVDLYIIWFSAQAEQELHKRFINWDAFETAAEPARKDYDYSGWRSASLRARWQIQLLHAFLSRNPQAKRTQNCLELWEKRINSSSDYKLGIQ